MSSAAASEISKYGTLAGLALLAVAAHAAPELPPMDCVIEPNEVVDLSSAVDGVIREMLADRGDLVEEGQEVVRLDSGVEDAALAYARARARADAQLQAEQVSAEFAKRRKERLETLYRQKALASDQMDEIATDARLKQLQLEQAAEARRLAQLDMRQAEEVAKRQIIRSPIRGVVVRRFLSAGESVENKAIMRIAQIDPLRAEVIIPVAHFGAVKVGQQAIVVPEAPRDQPYPAVVSVVDRVADAASGTFRATLTLPNPDYGLPSGLRCSVKFQVASELASRDVPAPPTPRPGSGAPALLAAGEILRPAPAVVPTPSRGPSRRLGPATVRGESRVARTSGGRDIAPVAPSVPPPAREEAPVARATQPQVAVASPPKPESICQTLGPVGDRNRARSIRTTLSPLSDEIVIREEAKGGDSASSYAILSAVPASASAAADLLRALQAAGFSDVALIKTGRYAGRVSAGVYSGPRSAAQRRDVLAARGFDFEVVPRGGAMSEYWLDLRASADPDSQLRLLAALRDLTPTVAASTVDCDPRILAARTD